MNLYIMRHGKAAERGRGGKDSERRLTAEGRAKTAQSAEGLKTLGLRFDRILCSPHLRARETAEIVAGILKCRRGVERTDLLLPEADFAGLLAEIAGQKGAAGDVLLVGHEPMLGELISLLVAGASGGSVVMKKGAVCKLSAERLKPGKCARLEWLLTVKQMSAMRGAPE